MKHRLADIQRAFAEEILRDQSESRLPSIANDSGNRNISIVDHILPGGFLTKEGSVEVYKSGYLSRLTDSLCETYPAIWNLMGDKEFFEVTRTYVYSHASRSENLSDYGDDFALYLNSFIKEHNNSPAVFVAVAQFEWKFAQLFHAKEPLTTESSLNLVPESVLYFGDHFFIQESPFSFFTLWEMALGYKEKQNTAMHGVQNKPETILAYKKNDQRYTKRLTPAQQQILQRLIGPLEPMSIEESLVGLESTPEEVRQLFELIGLANLAIRQK